MLIVLHNQGSHHQAQSYPSTKQEAQLSRDFFENTNGGQTSIQPPPPRLSGARDPSEKPNAEENYMGLISWIVVGAIAGMLAR